MSDNLMITVDEVRKENGRPPNPIATRNDHKFATRVEKAKFRVEWIRELASNELPGRHRIRGATEQLLGRQPV
jgi:hypothetical protein